MRVCQFRHFGDGLRSLAPLTRRLTGKTNLYSTDGAPTVKRSTGHTHSEERNALSAHARNHSTIGRGHQFADVVMSNSSKLPPEVVSRLRDLAHDLSNSIETIMQASYLLGQIELDPQGRKWVELIEEAAQDAAHMNRELREVLRS